MIKIALLLVALLHFGVASEKQLKITYVSPNVSSHQYFEQLSNFSHAVANNLGIKYETKFPQKNLDRFEYYEFLKSFYEAKDKPDVMMVFVYRQEGRKIFELAEKHHVKTVILNSYVDISTIGCSSKPQEVYDTYLAAVVADEEKAGYQLADALIAEARKRGKTKKLSILAIGGVRTSGESLQRNVGLQNRVAKDENVELHQLVFANWDKESAYDITKQALARYEDIDIIWCASDEMAIWAKKALNHIGKEGIVVGGIDWSLQGIDALDRGLIDVSVGGHFLNGGIALILLYDYFHGYDFSQSRGSIVSLNMTVLTRKNINEFLDSKLLNTPQLIDYKKFSKVFNPKLKNYDCSIRKLLHQ